MHAPAADLLLFALREDSRATNVFDTQVAAGFAGFGAGAGYERLVEAVLGVRLQHNETFSDWRRRPLSETQLAYAADDVRYLFPLVRPLARAPRASRPAGLGGRRAARPLRRSLADRARSAARLAEDRAARAAEPAPDGGARRGRRLAGARGATTRPAARLAGEGSEPRGGGTGTAAPTPPPSAACVASARSARPRHR